MDSKSEPDKQFGYLGLEKGYVDFKLTLDFKQYTDGYSVFLFANIEY
ncbi:hypothetical protein [Aureibaculum marinum]|nr:hypothetical protein [Aureibaculum marinum]